MIFNIPRKKAPKDGDIRMTICFALLPHRLHDSDTVIWLSSFVRIERFESSVYSQNHENGRPLNLSWEMPHWNIIKEE